jgi:hypothetical protein
MAWHGMARGGACADPVQVGLIGYGEVGSILGAVLAAHGRAGGHRLRRRNTAW